MDITTKITDGPLSVGVYSAKRPWAIIEFDARNEASYMTLASPADCDRLIIAATTAKRMLEASVAGTPHAYAGGKRCTLCGQYQHEKIHQLPVPALDSEGWTCKGCSGQMIGSRPEGDLCPDCANTALLSALADDALEDAAPQALITLACGCSFTAPATSANIVYCGTHDRHESVVSQASYGAPVAASAAVTGGAA